MASSIPRRSSTRLSASGSKVKVDYRDVEEDEEERVEIRSKTRTVKRKAVEIDEDTGK